MSAKSYSIESITINDVAVTKVLIADHYIENHADHINDVLILQLVQLLDGAQQEPEKRSGGYNYFVNLLELNNKQYRLIWLLEDDQVYIGVVNAYRDDRGKV